MTTPLRIAFLKNMCQWLLLNVSIHDIFFEGFRVVYDLKKPIGQRVVMLKALCSRCRVPQYQVVQKNERYKVR